MLQLGSCIIILYSYSVLLSFIPFYLAVSDIKLSVSILFRRVERKLGVKALILLSSLFPTEQERDKAGRERERE